MDTVFIVVSIHPVDGVRLSGAFHLISNAQLFAQLYGGSVRAVQVQEDEGPSTREQRGCPC